MLLNFAASTRGGNEVNGPFLIALLAAVNGAFLLVLLVRVGRETIASCRARQSSSAASASSDRAVHARMDKSISIKALPSRYGGSAAGSANASPSPRVGVNSHSHSLLSGYARADDW